MLDKHSTTELHSWYLEHISFKKDFYALPVSGLRWPVKMVPYSLDSENPAKSCKSRGSNLHVHFKNTYETAQTIKGKHIWKVTKNVKKCHFKETMCANPAV